jgi:CubicO group peptidase (beta-lactamase class C family)
VTSTFPFDQVWTTLEEQLESGRFPGYAAAIRYGDRTEIRTGGVTTLGGTVGVQGDTIFRIASLSKLVGGALALVLVRDGAFDLDAPVARWLPELESPRVLRHPGAELDDTVAAERPILVRHLLNFTFGLGFLLQESPLSRAMSDLDLLPGPKQAPVGPDELMSRVASLPLACQPGERWYYHTGSDLLGILVARAARCPLDEVVREHLTGPLGMKSTDFHAHDISRLTAAYTPGPSGLRLYDPADGAFAQRPVFESLGGGLVSTVQDYLAFLTSLRDGSAVLDAEIVRAMITESLSGEQRRGVQQLTGPGMSWGMCVGLDLERAQPWMRPGRFGWNGGSGTTACVDPGNDLVAVLLTQRAMQSAVGDFDDFWRGVYLELP